jgi:hypothetical protein
MQEMVKLETEKADYSNVIGEGYVLIGMVM